MNGGKPGSEVQPAAEACGASAAPMARYWRCALQVNPASYLAEYQKKEHGLSAEEYDARMAATARRLGIEVVGLADHSSAETSESLRRALEAAGIVVFPGFEVASSELIHFVCLFPETQSSRDLHETFGLLRPSPSTEVPRRSELAGQQLIEEVARRGGVAYAAHVTEASGLLQRKVHPTWRCGLLLAAQIRGSVEELRDAGEQFYYEVLTNRNPEYRRERPLALINARDVKAPSDLEDDRASTWIKMTRPTFGAFRLALKDPEGRVRRRDQLVESSHSRITRVRITGGYLDGLDIRLSPHLNAVIGGRGTGKSTLVECIRYAFALEPRTPSTKKLHEELIKNTLGKVKGRVEIDLVSGPKRGPFTVVRRYGEPPSVLDADGKPSSFGPRDLVPTLEVYGQNEIVEIAREPSALRGLLGRFVTKTSAEADRALAEIARRLAENAERLAKAEARHEELTAQFALLPKLEEEARQYRELGLEKQLEVVPLLEREQQLGRRTEAELSRVEEALKVLADARPDSAFLAETAVESLPHREVLRKLRGPLERAGTALNDLLVALESRLATSRGEVVAILGELSAAVRSSEDELQRVLKALPGSAGRSGRDLGAAFQDLLRRIEGIRPVAQQRDAQARLVAQLASERKGLMVEQDQHRDARRDAMKSAEKKLNKQLDGKLKVSIQPEGDRAALVELLASSGMDGVGEKRLEWARQEDGPTPRALAHAIRKGKDAIEQGGWGITPAVATALAGLSTVRVMAIEALMLPDSIAIELNVAHEGVTERWQPTDRLSTGQQCTAILQLLLLENEDPLVIDQPEDNLDNAFIAERIVTELRSTKDRRQFLFATHNANIPVFGDAEWIGVLEVVDGVARLAADRQGGIDLPVIREQAAAILEGGQRAFQRRKEQYGF